MSKPPKHRPTRTVCRTVDLSDEDVIALMSATYDHLPSRAQRLKPASGTEAQRATTVKQGVVHDGPVAKPDAQTASPLPPQGTE